MGGKAVKKPSTLAVLCVAVHAGSSVLQTEALQVLAALAKFYFPQISHCWQHLKDFYLSHLASLSHRVQQHVLKVSHAYNIVSLNSVHSMQCGLSCSLCTFIQWLKHYFV